MKSALFLVVGLLVLPPVAEAQVELGFDSGVTIERSGGINTTTFEVPSNWLRIGFGGETIAFESLVSLAHARALGQSVTVIEILPGIVYNYRFSTYMRGEVGLLVVSARGESANQFAYGVAVGTKRQIRPGLLYLRFEAGVDKWRRNNDFNAKSDFRFLVGISVVVN